MLRVLHPENHLICETKNLCLIILRTKFKADVFFNALFKTPLRDIRENIECRSTIFRLHLCTLERRSAQAKKSGIFYFSGIGIASGER